MASLRGFMLATLRPMRRVFYSTSNKGFQQANVLLLPSALAKDFEAFCWNNTAPLPLLYVSKSGETTCAPLAQNADIRTDVSQYCVYERGRMLKTVSSLKEYSSPLKDMVCFYLGCSFGFEGKLKEAGVPVRNVEQQKNVSMYRTSVPCVPAGVFHCPLVVTMRPVPAEMLDVVVEVTHLNPLAHGAPVHIGDPALLGIQDLSSPEYGDAVEPQPGDVPVFWACGVTSMEALRSTKPALAFTHSPGCMFLTDLPDSSSPTGLSHQSLDPLLTPLSFRLSHSPLFYSLASKRAVQKIRQLEKIIGEDPGERGISAIILQDELLLSCLALSHASSVAITTGFPTHYMHNPPDETDGPPGAIAMANMLLSLGKQVTMVTDRRGLQLNQDLMDEAVSSGYQQANVTMLPSHLALDFEAFCQSNAAAVPLIYRSQPGDTHCPPIAQDVDIRTDIPQYCVYENGKVVKMVSSLKEHSSNFSNMVCFYLGCSFGFEGKLTEAGVPVRNVEQKKNVSMYRTSVPCVPVGDFCCPLVVTMRPVPAELLDTVVEVTHLTPQAHGAPVHIGDPAFLGIQDLSRPDYGDAVEQEPGDVPVFWACGVTSLEALRRAKPALAFSHSPGCMFLTDLPDSAPPVGLSHQNLDPLLTPLSFRLSHRPLLYSVASKRAVCKIRKLEEIINEKNTGACVDRDELTHCCLALSHTSSIAIVTDNPNRLPPGCVAMVNMLLSLGKRVTVVTDGTGLNMDLTQEAVTSDLLAAELPLITFEDSGPDSALHFLCRDGEVNNRSYDHLVAVERSGQAAAVVYEKIKGNQHLDSPTEQLLSTAEDTPGISTSAVSNCGGFAVACGLFLLQTCPSHQRYLNRGLGLTQTAPPEDTQRLQPLHKAVAKEGDGLNEVMTRLLQVVVGPEAADGKNL